MTAHPTLTSPAPQPDRDHWGRPFVVPTEGGKPVPYTRTTTFVKVVEDNYNLTRWQLRMAALGLTDRQDLRLAVAAHRDDKQKLNQILEEAQEAAKAHAAATTGTALHAFTEQVDRGEEPVVPIEYAPDLAAYQQATRELQALMIEQFCVQDVLKVAGTPDRVVKYNGKRYIADVKTGSIEFGYLSIAAQLAMYAHARPYNVATGERMDYHGADLERGIVIHLPAGTGTCTLYWVDLTVGWELCKLARNIREARQQRFPQLMRELHPVPIAPPTIVPAPVVTGEVDDLVDGITAATTEAAIRQLWRASTDRWTEMHTELARERIAELASTTTTPTTKEQQA